jgi:hypothetical protein
MLAMHFLMYAYADKRGSKGGLGMQAGTADANPDTTYHHQLSNYQCSSMPLEDLRDSRLAK